MFFVYILQYPLGRLYIGQTSDLQLRLRRHNEGKVFSTKDGGPWQLIYSESFATRSAAMTQERRLKAVKNKKALMDHLAQR